MKNWDRLLTPVPHSRCLQANSLCCPLLGYTTQWLDPVNLRMIFFPPPVSGQHVRSSMITGVVVCNLWKDFTCSWQLMYKLWIWPHFRVFAIEVCVKINTSELKWLCRCAHPLIIGGAASLNGSCHIYATVETVLVGFSFQLQNIFSILEWSPALDNVTVVWYFLHLTITCFTVFHGTVCLITWNFYSTLLLTDTFERDPPDIVEALWRPCLVL